MKKINSKLDSFKSLKSLTVCLLFFSLSSQAQFVLMPHQKEIEEPIKGDVKRINTQYYNSPTEIKFEEKLKPEKYKSGHDFCEFGELNLPMKKVSYNKAKEITYKTKFYYNFKDQLIKEESSTPRQNILKTYEYSKNDQFVIKQEIKTLLQINHRNKKLGLRHGQQVEHSHDTLRVEEKYDSNGLILQSSYYRSNNDFPHYEENYFRNTDDRILEKRSQSTLAVPKTQKTKIEPKSNPKKYSLVTNLSGYHNKRIGTRFIKNASRASYQYNENKLIETINIFRNGTRSTLEFLRENQDDYNVWSRSSTKENLVCQVKRVRDKQGNIIFMSIYQPHMQNYLTTVKEITYRD